MKPEGSVFDSVWRKACDVRPINRSDAQAMIAAHYLGKWPGVCVLSLGLWRDDKPLGVIVYALPPRETAKRYGGVTWELARLWIDDSVPTNAETFLIAAGTRHIKKTRPEVMSLVSYADPSAGHAGVIYKAAGWVADGRTDDDRKTPRFDYGDARTGKRYSRKGHVPHDAQIVRFPRVSKARFVKHIGARK